MVWDPENKVWKGNEQDLEIFRTAKPILIAPMGNSSLQTANIFLQASKLTQAVSASKEVHSDAVSDEGKDDHLTLVKPEPIALPKMTFDPVNKCWIGNEEEEDIFKDISIDADTAPTSMPPEFQLTQQDKDLIRHCERVHDECLAGWASHSDICTNPAHKDALRSVSICVLLQFLSKGRVGEPELTEDEISSSETDVAASSPKVAAPVQKVVDVTDEWGDDLVVPDAPLELCTSQSAAPGTETDDWEEGRERASDAPALPAASLPASVSSNGALNLGGASSLASLPRSSSMVQNVGKKGPKLFTLDMLPTLQKQQEEEQKSRKFLKLPESGGMQSDALDDLDDLDWGDTPEDAVKEGTKEPSASLTEAHESAETKNPAKNTEEAENPPSETEGKSVTHGAPNAVAAKPATDAVGGAKEGNPQDAAALSCPDDDWGDDFGGDAKLTLSTAKNDGQEKAQAQSEQEADETDWGDDFGDVAELTLSAPRTQEGSGKSSRKEDDWGDDFGEDDTLALHLPSSSGQKETPKEEPGRTEEKAGAFGGGSGITLCLPERREPAKQRAEDGADWDSAFDDDPRQHPGKEAPATTPNSVKSLDLGNPKRAGTPSAACLLKEAAAEVSASPGIVLHSPSPLAKKKQSETPPPHLGAKQPKSVKFACAATDGAVPKIGRTHTALALPEGTGGERKTRRAKTLCKKYQTVVLTPRTAGGAAGAVRCRPIRMGGKGGLATASRALAQRVMRTSKAQHDADFLQNLADDVALRQPSGFLRSRRCVRALCRSVRRAEDASDASSAASSSSSVSDLSDLSDGESVEDWGDVEVPETPLRVVRPCAAVADTYDDLGVDAPQETPHEEHHSPDPLFSDDFETPDEEPLDTVFKTDVPLVVAPAQKEPHRTKPGERGGGCSIQ